ncbi:MAG: hypothetical protein QMD46_08455 [Methanomicrobiales archaeon]|nr:hypothetical protein [Methanomicrobiales archaeon]MDI6876277.1 hypothetical protein [Methanomicrobiales archaeon]
MQAGLQGWRGPALLSDRRMLPGKGEPGLPNFLNEVHGDAHRRNLARIQERGVEGLVPAGRGTGKVRWDGVLMLLRG